MIKRTKLNNLEERKKCLANLGAGDYGVYFRAKRRLEEIVVEEELEKLENQTFSKWVLEVAGVGVVAVGIITLANIIIGWSS